MFRARRSTIKIVGLRGFRTHQPKVSFVEVTRGGRPKSPTSGWQRAMRRRHKYDGLVYLTWNGREWVMPPGYREVA